MDGVLSSALFFLHLPGRSPGPYKHEINETEPYGRIKLDALGQRERLVEIIRPDECQLDFALRRDWLQCGRAKQLHSILVGC